MELTKEDVARTMTANGQPTTPEEVTDEMLLDISRQTGIEVAKVEEVTSPPTPELPKVEVTSPQTLANILEGDPSDPGHPAYAIWQKARDALVKGDPQGDPNHPLHALYAEKQRLFQENQALKKAIPDPIHDLEINNPDNDMFGGISLEEATLQGGEVMKEFLVARDAYRDGIATETYNAARTQADQIQTAKTAWQQTIDDFKAGTPDAPVDKLIERHSQYLPDGSPNPRFTPLTLPRANILYQIEEAGGLEAYNKAQYEKGFAAARTSPPITPPTMQSLTNSDGRTIMQVSQGLPLNFEEVKAEVARGRKFSYQQIVDMEKSGVIPAGSL